MPNTTTLSDQALINGIAQNDTPILKAVYEAHLPSIIALVKNNKGTAADAKDVFQEAILLIYRKAQASNFELQGSFGGFLYGICRFLWLRQLKKKHRSHITIEGQEGQLKTEDVEKWQVEEEKWQLFREVFARLGADCQRVLQLFFDGYSMKAIAEKTGHSLSYVKLKKFKCKEKFSDWMKAEVRYNELMNN